ncbi:glycosyltransferase [Parafilimonas sp.]|uniref:glycosyltransferase n=1 Tax=Parafilimonas sp. TaxID=1969739 RepID=UPI0039E701EB
MPENNTYKPLLAAVVVLYFPDENLINNIYSYLPLTNKLFIVDNTDEPDFKSNYLPGISALGNKAVYLPNSKNEGIGAALNLAAANALKDNYQWLLTMDQDSYFAEEDRNKYFSFFQQQISANKNIGVAAPSHKRKLQTIAKEYSEVNAVITSGSIVNLNAWQQVNGYNENLFVDEVDADFCYRVKLHKYKILLLNNIFLQHQLGKKTNSGYLGFIAKRKRTIHSPLRVYYMVRNYLFVKNKYSKFFPAEFKERDRLMLVALKNNLLFSGKFFQNCKSILKGYLDYKKKRLS